MFRDIKKRRKRHIRAGHSIDKDQNDTNFYACKVCGWTCNSDTVEVASARPEASEELTGVVMATDTDGDTYPTQPRGCPNCGSLYSR